MSGYRLPDQLMHTLYRAAIDAQPCVHYHDSRPDGQPTCLGCQVDAAVHALLAACQVREEWAVFTPDAAVYDTVVPCGPRRHETADQARKKAERRAAGLGGEVRVAYTIRIPFAVPASPQTPSFASPLRPGGGGNAGSDESRGDATVHPTSAA